MKLRVRSTGMKLSQPISHYLRKKMQKLEKYLDFDNSNAEVNLDVEGYRQTAEIIIYSKKKTIVAKETSPEIYQSIDKVTGKMEKRLRREKEKKRR
ncbi:MAG: ribosome-associated translation inhibitor RaiA [Candidatus Omnitrophica bacterium]|nr:ribosome-associated translation inhibitor RaiA [Candidatus Omnitrophota bacterium]